MQKQIINKKTGYKKPTESGFSLVEIIIASAIITVSLLSIIGLAHKSTTVSNQAIDTYIASTLLEEGAEAVRTLRDGAWTNISGLTAGTSYYLKFNSSTNTWSATTTSSDGVVGIFTRKFVIGAVNRDGSDNIATSGTNDTGTKLVTVTVSWTRSSTSLSKTLQFYTFDAF